MLEGRRQILDDLPSIKTKICTANLEKINYKSNHLITSSFNYFQIIDNQYIKDI